MKVGRNDIINIATEKYKLSDELVLQVIDYEKWVKFIELQINNFVWYENTDEGKRVVLTINERPKWVKDKLSYLLNKKSAYYKRKSDLIVTYSTKEGMLFITLEKKMSKEIADILLKMAEYVGGKLIINGTKELENVEQLD